MKDRHKWSKELADIEFYFKDLGSEGVILWQK